MCVSCGLLLHKLLVCFDIFDHCVSVSLLVSSARVVVSVAVACISVIYVFRLPGTWLGPDVTALLNKPQQAVWSYLPGKSLVTFDLLNTQKY